MSSNKNRYIKSTGIIVIAIVFGLLFLFPYIFVRKEGEVVWRDVIKIWQDRVFLIPLFVINHWILVPKFILTKKYSQYLLSTIVLILFGTLIYYYIETGSLVYSSHSFQRHGNRVSHSVSENGNHQVVRERPPRMRPPRPMPPTKRPPGPIPPYADLLLFSILIITVDTGMSYMRYWHDVESEKNMLVRDVMNARLGMLRHQVNPHFLMNTLNNIYSLIGKDRMKSREAIIKLSKLMRYLLYENKDGKVKLGSELEFIKSYIDLMELRYSNDVDVKFTVSENGMDVEIPILLFTSYIENAFKYGVSHRTRSKIEITFRIEKDTLYFSSENDINVKRLKSKQRGIGLENNRQRLDLLFKDQYSLNIHEANDKYRLELSIPLAIKA